MGDLPEPGAEPSAVMIELKLSERRHKPREYLLHDVEGIVLVDAALTHVRQQQRTVEGHEFPPGRRVGRIADTLKQGNARFQHNGVVSFVFRPPPWPGRCRRFMSPTNNRHPSSHRDLRPDVHDVKGRVIADGPREVDPVLGRLDLPMPCTKQFLIRRVRVRKRQILLELVLLRVRRVREPCLVAREMIGVEAVPLRGSVPVIIEATLELVQRVQ